MSTERAERYNTGKAEHHWLDAWPHALRRVAEVFGYGARKYSAYNYKKGAPFSESYNCARRHMIAWFNGEDFDVESKCHHLAHAAWNIMRLLDEQENPSPGTQDNRPKPAIPSFGALTQAELEVCHPTT